MRERKNTTAGKQKRQGKKKKVKQEKTKLINKAKTE